MIRFFLNPLKPQSENVRREVASLARALGLDGLDVVIGGDGTLLHYLSELSQTIFAISLSVGRSGICQADVSNWRNVLKNWAESKEVEGRWTLKAFGPGWEKELLNEVIVFRADARPIELELMTGKGLSTKWRGDGVLIATATGSTGYASSLVHVHLHPELKVFLIVPFAPLSPLPARIWPDDTIRVRVLKKARVEGDGEVLGELKPGEELSISFYRMLKFVKGD